MLSQYAYELFCIRVDQLIFKNQYYIDFKYDKEAKREFGLVSLSCMPRAQLNASSQSHNNLDDPMPGMSIANNI